MGESHLRQRNCSFHDVSASFSLLTYKWKEDANVKGQNEEQVKKQTLIHVTRGCQCSLLTSQLTEAVRSFEASSPSLISPFRTSRSQLQRLQGLSKKKAACSSNRGWQLNVPQWWFPCEAAQLRRVGMITQQLLCSDVFEGFMCSPYISIDPLHLTGLPKAWKILLCLIPPP